MTEVQSGQQNEEGRGIGVTLNVAGTAVCARRSGLRTPQPSPGFIGERSGKAEPVSSSCVEGSALLMSGSRGEWTDWSETVERHWNADLTCLDAQHVQL